MVSNSSLYFFAVALTLLVAELIYFRIAIRYNIVDKPNDRSSHVNHAIRGGGIIFIIAILIWFYTSNFLWPWFVLGACAIAVISFLDDVISLNQLVRFLVQLISVLLLFLQVWPICWPIYLLLIALIVCIGALNAFNFMDGINGITGVYALVALFTFGFIQQQIVSFTDIFLLGVVVLSVLIFLFFNFRQQARCFAGDIGSITIAFILIFFLLQLIQVTGNFLWPLLFLVYGTDSIVTIIYRLKRKENIFKPHRTHLFQYLSNELKWSHRSVAVVYGSVQLVINCVLVNTLAQQQYLLPLVLSGLFIVAYLVARKIVLSKIGSVNG
jgi:UDP-N-acetylmuramyl pentapeptide phosphotransferase/UDP-N-acetylglucosamine-1-phosphate transferase